MEIERAGPERVWDLRHRVLRADQAPETARWPGDAEALHWVAVEAGEVVAVVSLFPTPSGPEPWQLRGMAVRADQQGRGVGARLLAALHAAHDAAHAGQGIWCNARIRAVPFYARAGWQVEGESFDLPGIGPHLRMRRRARGSLLSPGSP